MSMTTNTEAQDNALPPERFSAIFDQPSQVSTLTAIVFLLLSAMALSIMSLNSEMKLAAQIFTGLAIFVTVVGWWATVRVYILDDKGLVIVRLLYIKTIKYSQIESTVAVNYILRDDIYGIGFLSGIFGYRGKYRLKDEPEGFISYANSLDSGVFIKTQRSVIFISPENLPKFVSSLESKLLN